MHSRLIKAGVFALLLLFGLSCSHTPDIGDRGVSSMIYDRVGHPATWQFEESCKEQISEAVQTLLQRELNAQTVLQILFLNSPQIQEIYEEIGIAQADLVEAGLLSNPAFDLFLRYPDKKRFVTDIEYTLTSSFVDILLIPLRLKVAQDELEQITLRVTHKILNLAFETEEIFYTLQAAQQNLNYARSIAELTALQSELTSRQQKAGNVFVLELQQARSQTLEGELEFLKQENRVLSLQEKLRRLLGLREAICLKIEENSPEIPCPELSLETLTSLAFYERLDLQEARFNVLRIGDKLGLKQWWTYTEGRIGIAGERDPDRLNTLGPALTGQIPLFNYGQADRMRIEAQLRQAQEHLAALEIQVLSEVREAYRALQKHREIVNNYQNELLPLQDEVAANSEALYRVMGLGIDRLLETKRQQLILQNNTIHALLQYRLATIALERAIGGKLLSPYARCPE